MKSGESSAAAAALSSTDARDAELVHRHHPMRPVEQLRPQGARDAKEVGDHGDGDRGRESLDQLRRAVSREGVDPRMGERGDAGRELLDLAGDEGAIDEVSEPRVLGRLHFQDRAALERVERRQMGLRRRPAEFVAAHDMQDLAAEAAVAQQRRDVGVRGKAPKTVVLPEEDGRGGADRGIGRIRVVEEGGIAGIEADAPAAGVDDGGHGTKPLTAIFCPILNVFKELVVTLAYFPAREFNDFKGLRATSRFGPVAGRPAGGATGHARA